MVVLRVYDPPDCDEHGVPLDWERCRTCHGVGKLSTLGIDIGVEVVTRAVMEALRPCSSCDGHGSLKAAALHHWRMSVTVTHTFTTDEPMVAEGVIAGALPRAVRCEDCGHPMSEGTWEAPQGPPVGVGEGGIWGPPDSIQHATYLAAVERWLREGGEAGAEGNPRWAWVHYSPCDEGCRHGGPGRWWDNDFGDWHVGDLPRRSPGWTRSYFRQQEASWRPVDVRTLGWPHDLRPEKLAVLCLRCYAERIA